MLIKAQPAHCSPAPLAHPPTEPTMTCRQSSFFTEASDMNHKANPKKKIENYSSVLSPFSQGGSRRTQDARIQAVGVCSGWMLPPLLILSSSQLSPIIVPQPGYKQLSPGQFYLPLPESPTLHHSSKASPPYSCFLQIRMASTSARSLCRFYSASGSCWLQKSV